VEHLQDTRVKNYASSVYILKANSAVFYEGLGARGLELVSIKAVHRLLQHSRAAAKSDSFWRASATRSSARESPEEKASGGPFHPLRDMVLRCYVP
jgi:hypothetical protein